MPIPPRGGSGRANRKSLCKDLLAALLRKGRGSMWIFHRLRPVMGFATAPLRTRTSGTWPVICVYISIMCFEREARYCSTCPGTMRICL
jgi:hypothetical protein